MGHLYAFQYSSKGRKLNPLYSIAGSDTSSTTISYILWELSRRPDILSRVQLELDEAMSDSRIVPDISILQELPYFNALIKEGKKVTQNSHRALIDHLSYQHSDSTPLRQVFSSVSCPRPPTSLDKTKTLTSSDTPCRQGPWSAHKPGRCIGILMSFLPPNRSFQNVGSSRTLLQITSSRCTNTSWPLEQAHAYAVGRISLTSF
jgi:Cytochrome P450